MSNLAQLINQDEPELPPPDTDDNNSQDGDYKEESEQEEPKPAPPQPETNGDSSGRVTQETIEASFERIKTHFPAARIKKIMQSDDDIGKVAQATPIIVGRALEIFMANLVESAIIESRKQGVKRISASHIRAAVENCEQFDFLVDSVAKYPPMKH
ncbi:negative cofactor 2 complex subunit alpha [Diutina catenulata]